MAYTVVTTVLGAAASRDLTDLATVKDELSIAAGDTGDDAWLGRAITQVSRAIERHCKRAFAPEYLQDAFDVEQDPYPYQTLGGFPKLQLSRWPVLAVASVVQTLAGGATPTTQALVADVDYRLDDKTGQLLRLNPFTGVATTWEALPVTVIYTAGLGALVTEAHTVGGSPYHVTATDAAIWSCAHAVTYASGVALAQVSGGPAQGQFSAAAGVYIFNAADTGQALSFTYATLAIDPDLVGICLRLITARFAAKGRDPALIQRETPGMGTERFWFGGAPGQHGQFPPDIDAMLADFRVPTVA